MRTCLIVVTLLLVADVAAASDAPTIEGFLTAADAGKRINWAFVLLDDYTSVRCEAEYASHNMEVRTGPDGHFKVEAGCYDLFVSATWVAPLPERVCVQKGQSSKVKLRMKADRRANFANRLDLRARWSALRLTTTRMTCNPCRARAAAIPEKKSDNRLDSLS
jgi:hypothetical protein